ncbi:MAG: MFS transporter [Clostridium sp.]|nr:MFS transporter [Clostridium sp.]
MSNTVLSLLMVAQMFFAFIGSVFWGQFCDRLHTNKKALLLGMGLTVALSVMCYLAAGSLWLTFIFYPLLGFNATPMASNIDAWIMRSFPEKHGCVGISRATSSVVYGVISLVCSTLMENVGYFSVVVIGVFCCIFTIIDAALLPDVFTYEKNTGGGRIKEDISLLLKNPPFLSLLVMLFLTGLAIAPINNMKIVILQSVGGTVEHLGISSFIGCIVQVPFFLLAAKMYKIPAQARMMFAFVGQFATFIICFAAGNPWTIVFGGTLGYITYCVILTTYRDITEEVVEPKLFMTACEVTDAVYGTLAGMAALTYSGAMVDLFGVKALMLLCAVIQVIPMCFKVQAAVKFKQS